MKADFQVRTWESVFFLRKLRKYDVRDMRNTQFCADLFVENPVFFVDEVKEYCKIFVNRGIFILTEQR